MVTEVGASLKTLKILHLTLGTGVSGEEGVTGIWKDMWAREQCIWGCLSAPSLKVSRMPYGNQSRNQMGGW